MKFNRWSMTRIRAGDKILTSRKKRYDNDEDVLEIIGEMPWWFIKTYLYKLEGAESPEQLQSVINQIFRRVVEDDERFFVHHIDTYNIMEKS
jgi:hypothetical protein